MARYIHEGRLWDYTPSGADVTAGDVVVLGSPGVVGVAPNNIADGELGALQVQGVCEFPKDTGTLTAGDCVKWDGTNMVAATAGANHGIVSDTTDGTVVRVYIDPAFQGIIA